MEQIEQIQYILYKPIYIIPKSDGLHPKESFAKYARIVHDKYYDYFINSIIIDVV